MDASTPSTAPNLFFSSPGLVLNGQNVGGGINFAYAVPTQQNISTFVTQAANLTQNAFANDTSFFNVVQSSQNAQQRYISNNVLNSFALIAATTQQANQQSANVSQATLNAAGGSFISTATLYSVCDEKEALNKILKMEKWRDEWIRKQEGGCEIIKKYERIAPALVNRISKREDAKKIWRRTYLYFINPILQMLDRGDNCDMVYVSKMYVLAIQYLKSKNRKK